MYQETTELPRELMDRALPDIYTRKIIPDVPRLRGKRPDMFRTHPLVVYSAFVTVSLLLLGSMAVASLPV